MTGGHWGSLTTGVVWTLQTPCSPPVAGAGDAATTSAENGRHGMLLTGAARSTIESCTADGRGCRVCLEPPRFSGRRKPPSSGCTRRSEASTARRTLLFGGHRSCGTPAGRMVSGAMAAPAAERRTYAANPARRRRGVNGPGGTHNWRSNGCDPGDWRCCCGRPPVVLTVTPGAVRRRYDVARDQDGYDDATARRLSPAIRRWRGGTERVRVVLKSPAAVRAPEGLTAIPCGRPRASCRTKWELPSGTDRSR